MPQPLVSVIIPARDSEKTLGNAIQSIQSQSYPNLEIIVVDDYSSDNTKEIVLKRAAEDSRIKYLHMPYDDPERFDHRLNKNINAGFAAKNFGYENAKGEILTSQDADDVSFLNRIEVQLDYLKKFNGSHITTGWIPFNDKFIGKSFDVDSFLKDSPVSIKGPEEIYLLSKRTKGLVPKLFPYLSRLTPFHLKRWRVINKLFWASLEPYPGAASHTLFKREIFEKVKMRKLKDREWPNFMGRGSDRDFNFKIAEVFRNSYYVPIPLYMWHTRENNDPKEAEKFAKYLK